jgi:hypothetical protein
MFRRLGFVHLLSSTGIHLYACIAVWDRMIQGFCILFGIPVRKGLWISRASSFVLCFCIWILTGARLGMLRPALVILAKYLAQFMGFSWKKSSPLLLALVLDSLVGFIRSWQGHDFSISQGRWIYALAVGGGLYWHSCFRSTHLGLAVGSWALVALWEVWEIGTLSLATPLLSLVTLPLVCTWIYPGILLSLGIYFLGFHHLGVSLIEILSEILNSAIFFLTQLVMLPWNLWIIPRNSFLISIVFASIAITLRLSLKLSRRHTLLAYCTFLTSLFAFRAFVSLSSVSTAKELEAHRIEQLDVGQGDAALVQSGKNGLIDTGSQKALRDDQWIQILAQQKIQKLDWVALTHLDEDHSG